MSRVLATAIISLLTLDIGVSAFADGLDSNPIPANKRQTTWTSPEFDSQAIAASNRVNFGLAFTGGLETKNQGSSLRAFSSDGQSRICNFTLDCLGGAFTRLEAIGALPRCAVSATAPCIESLNYSIDAGPTQAAEYAFTVDPSPTADDIQKAKSMGATTVQSQSGWSTQELPGFPASASGPIVFHLPGALNGAGTDTYAVESNFIIGPDGLPPHGGISQFHLSIVPVLDDQSTHCESTWYGFKQGSQSLTNGIGCADDQRAYFSSKSTGWAASFPAGLTLQLKLKLPSNLGGWLQGRAETPNVTVTPQADKTNEVVLEAAPTTIPVTAAPVPVFDPAYQNVADIFGLNSAFWDGFRSKDKSTPGTLLLTGDGWTPNRGGSTLLGTLSQLVGNKAKGTISAWEFKQLASTGLCMNDSTSLQGLLTTNAMTYQPETPAYKNGFLNYSVAGLHYNAAGEVSKGTYYFTMRDSVARCLYGFKGKGPISGTVSITSDDGQEQVSTTSVRDDGTWLKLTALGFTFSNPTIRVKLSQSSALAPQSASTYCIKGKVRIRLSKPALPCPMGYKKQ